MVLTGMASYALAWVAASRIDAEAAEAFGGESRAEDDRNVEMDWDGEDVRDLGARWDCTSRWACMENHFATQAVVQGVESHAGEARDWN